MPKIQKLTAKFGSWIDIRKLKPKKGERILVCYDDHEVCIDTVEDVENIHVGHMTWLQYHKFEGSKVIAWMPLPPTDTLKKPKEWFPRSKRELHGMLEHALSRVPLPPEARQAGALEGIITASNEAASRCLARIAPKIKQICR